MFAAYAAVVKNLRGVIMPAYSGECGGLRWLAARFRYREVGVPPSAARLAEAGGRFRILTYPVPVLAQLTDYLEFAGLPRHVAEALVMGSVYVSPVLMVGGDVLDVLRGISVGVVEKCREMDLRSWRLHLRIATYSILDMYADCLEEALRVIRGEAGLGEVLAARRGRVEKDSSRYWRISCREGESGEPFLLYIDMLALSSGFVHRLVEDQAAGLAVVPVVYIPCGIG